jgi:hypothetical protein
MNASTDHVLWGCSLWKDNFTTTNMAMFNLNNLREELEIEPEQDKEEQEEVEHVSSEGEAEEVELP